jgi:hypothetical protein
MHLRATAATREVSVHLGRLARLWGPQSEANQQGIGGFGVRACYLCFLRYLVLMAGANCKALG